MGGWGTRQGRTKHILCLVTSQTTPIKTMVMIMSMINGTIMIQGGILTKPMATHTSMNIISLQWSKKKILYRCNLLTSLPCLPRWMGSSCIFGHQRRGYQQGHISNRLTGQHLWERRDDRSKSPPYV